MNSYLIKNAQIVNESKIFEGDLLIKNGTIEAIGKQLSSNSDIPEINAEGFHLFPGVIDDQVHFREPGLTHKACIETESKAAVAGGVTSFMEMPNTKPPALTLELLEDKYAMASEVSPSNYSFYLGASNDNIEVVKTMDPSRICGVKVFMGSSTGNMLVDNEKTLEAIFKSAPSLIATHCEEEKIVKSNEANFLKKYGDAIPIESHPLIRSREACFASSSKAIELAKRYDARLHVLHISTMDELALFNNKISLKDKKITSEVCIHHLWFNDKDYSKYGTHIKWNPAVKTEEDQKALMEAMINGTLDVIATDHAPHTLEEKNNSYMKAPSGGPLIQHSLLAMLDFYHKGYFDLTLISEKMAHNLAILYGIKERGYIREGYKADLVLVDLNAETKVNKVSLMYKCGWSPFEGHTFKSQIVKTFVNGHLAYSDGKVCAHRPGERLAFKKRF